MASELTMLQGGLIIPGGVIILTAARAWLFYHFAVRPMHKVMQDDWRRE